jgi:hypothetical protein
MLADDALYPLDRTQEYSVDASILERNSRGNPELPAPAAGSRSRHGFVRGVAMNLNAFDPTVSGACDQRG